MQPGAQVPFIHPVFRDILRPINGDLQARAGWAPRRPSSARIFSSSSSKIQRL
ncbi:hypothetical protein SMKI_10G3110 [Saccharomyces mikatae IFO 1815]|uniref:Uncharacterized protein n=1 Tax=Saccharomyces mikatae IFO 1815 TaxID=226126 RepID=A0AA35IQW7_SACMI|nr:uncharacterized protein SMKI_10G3110 [Saccharomyces mikatae IFO 1815]CAI4034518.1 hypothetical protein SMKI_10G3110 [Saccharomyces mikatae IFO 1815]